MPRFATVLVLACLALAACGEHHVTLTYRLEEGRLLRYRLLLEADLTRTLEGETTEERIVASFRSRQEVLEPLAGGGARAIVSLDPVALTVNEEPQDVGPGQRFLVSLGPDGEIVALEDTSGSAAEPLELVGLERLLPRLRPVLPGGPVRPGDAWRSGTDLADEAGTFSLESSSRLAELGRIDGRDAALVRTVYTSPVRRREALANAVADLDGTDVGTQEAWFALTGFLLRAEGDSVGRYSITFRPPGGEAALQPIEGRLEVRLHAEMELVG